MENNYCATAKTFVQVSPDDFETVTKVFSVNENTTIGEIVEWHKKNVQGFINISITEMDKSNTQP